MPRASRSTLLPVLALSLLITGAAPPAEPESELSPTGRTNLEALAHLLSLVRYFHPSDGAAACDWNTFTTAAVERAELAPDAVSLAALLQGLVRPNAPTVQIFPADRVPPLPAALTRPADPAARRVGWRHYGVAFGESKSWSSERIDDRTGAGFAQLTQALPAASVAGKRVRFSAEARARLEPGASAALWLRVDFEADRPSRLERLGGDGITGEDFRRYEVETEVEPDARSVSVGALLLGAGTLWLDGAALETLGGPSREIELANADFERGEPGRQPPGWDFPYASVRAGYRLALRTGAVCTSGGCAEIDAGPIARATVGEPSAVETIELAPGVSARVPRALWADDRGTLPHVNAPARAVNAASARAEGLAAVILAWGALRHFYPYGEEMAVDWDAMLARALSEVAAAGSPEARLTALRRMTVPLGDLRATVHGQGESAPAALPLEWEWIEDRLLITRVAEGTGQLRIGDEVRAIAGTPAAQRLDEQMATLSAPTLPGRRAQALDELLFGPARSKVELELVRSSGSGEALIRTEVTFDRAWDAPPLDLDGAVRNLASGILYVDLRRLSDGHLPKLLPSLRGAAGIVFDLRGAVDVSTIWLSQLLSREALSSNWNIPVRWAPAPSPPEYLTTFWTIPASDPKYLVTAKAAFLVDERASGYTETMLALVEDQKIGALVGSPSAGANGNPNHMPLPGGFTLTFTGMKVTRRDGSRFHGLGVRPTVPAVRTIEGLRAGRDEVIEAGVGAVRSVLGGSP